MLELKTAYVSEPGGRLRNEDACGYWTCATTGCWIVSDGAGGHGSGDLASRLVVSRILQDFVRHPAVGADYAVELLREANAAVIAAKREGITQDDMYATAALLTVDLARGCAIWAHTGDTRLYLLRSGDILHRSRDHSLVQHLIDAGHGSEALLRTHPQRSLLTSALGSAEEIELAIGGEDITLIPGDVFLLCTDGWWQYVDETTMRRTLAVAGSPQQWLAAMGSVLTRVATSEHDNYTALSVFICRPATEATADSTMQETSPPVCA